MSKNELCSKRRSSGRNSSWCAKIVDADLDLPLRLGHGCCSWHGGLPVRITDGASRPCGVQDD
jgi:hypothetical protein